MGVVAFPSTLRVRLAVAALAAVLLALLSMPAYGQTATPLPTETPSPTATPMPLLVASSYTITLSTGDVVTVERRLSYGELYIVTLLVFVSLMCVFGIILIAVRFKG